MKLVLSENSTLQLLSSSRKIVVDGTKVTSAVWGTLDQYLITGHEDGTVAKYDILKVCIISATE